MTAPARPAAALLGLVLLGAAGCGTASPTDRFARGGEDQRLLQRYDVRDARASYEVSVPGGATRLTVRQDCVDADGRGEMDVRVADVGSTGVPCRTESAAGGEISLGKKDLPSGPLTVVVTAPRGSAWSVAVDAR